MKNLKQINYCKTSGALATFDARTCTKCVHFTAAAGSCPGIGRRAEVKGSGIPFRIGLAITLLASSILAGHHESLEAIPGLGRLAVEFSRLCSSGNQMVGWVISAALALTAAGLCVQTGMSTLTVMAGYGEPGMTRA